MKTLTGLARGIVDALWAVGGIGAAAELGCEDFGPHPFLASPLAACPVECAGVRGARRPARRPELCAPLEAELCLNPVARRSVR